MNQHPQYTSFPPQQRQQQQQAFAYQTTPYETPPAPQASFQYPISTPRAQAQALQHHGPPQHVGYYQGLPQGLPQTAPVSHHQHQQQQQPHQQQRQTPQRRPAQRQRPQPLQRQQQSAPLRHASSPVPDTPGNGPGAPRPPSESPPASYEDDLMNALRQENEGHVMNGNANSSANANINSNVNAESDDDDDDDDDQDVVDDGEPVYQLPAPPEAEYKNETELEEAIHAWSLEHGYELVRRASKKNAKNQLYKRYYHCSKHGRVTKNKTPQKDRVRMNRKSNRIGCPMSLAAVAVNPHDPTGNWQIRHRKRHHNHPAVDAKELAGHRRRARAGGVETVVDGLFAIGTKTNDVLKFLQKTNPNSPIQRTDVANMKMKWQKHGTCAYHGGNTQIEKPATPTPTPGKTGFPSACDHCRSKKTKCDAVRPVCGTCVKSKASCHYSHNSHPRAPQPAQQPAQQPPQNPSNHLTQQALQGADSMQIDDVGADPSSFIDLTNSFNNPSSQNAAQAHDVFAALAAFQQEHVKPHRLTFEHSSVEYLASSTCGSGESYRTAIPHPFALGADWRTYRDAFQGAAIRENCADVLSGEKKEPYKPIPIDIGGEVPVEEWNEYVKQYAIYRRRNDMLRLAFQETLSPGLWSRVKLLQTAHEIWTMLEDMCMPRGSDQAYRNFSEVSSVTLQNSSNNIDTYIHALESKVIDYNALSSAHESRRPAAALNQSNTAVSKRKAGGNGTFPDEMLCFLFLRNLGPQHQNLAANLTKKNNIGGFGSGERVTFRELALLVKRSLDAESRPGRS